MDGPELTPATRKRPLPDGRPVEPVVATPVVDDRERFEALEAVVQGIDVRLEHLERTVTAGFQEAASRSLVVAEATDEVLARIESTIGTAPRPAPAPAPGAGDGEPPADLVDVGARLAQIQERLDDLAGAVVELQPTIDAILDLRSHVELVGGRLSELLGGPSLTELMDRIDEIADERRNR